MQDRRKGSLRTVDLDIYFVSSTSFATEGILFSISDLIISARF